MEMKNEKSGFDHDLNQAMSHGNFFERIFHGNRVKFWLSAADYDNKKVLDIGCNTGIVLIPLLEKGVDAVGIDISSTNIAIAKKNLKNKKLPKDVVRIGDAQRLPFKTNHFDIVLLSDVLEHVEDSRKAAMEAVRVTKKGGLILVTVPNERHPVVKFSFVRKILTSRKDVDEHPDIPFNTMKLLQLFPNTTVIKKGFIGFGSEILGVFKK